MYYRHFGLDGPPFRFTPSPGVLYLGAAHRECLAALEWALLHDQCGFMLLMGETGTGKTTLLNTVMSRQLPNLQIASVPNPRLSFVEIMRVVLPQLGVTTNERGKLELIQALERAVAKRPLGSRTAIIIDEAQNLTDENLEDLRLLVNSVNAQEREIQIVLMGHPELIDRLSAHHLRQLRERISTKVTLPGLSAPESLAYIDCRLKAQSGSMRLFEADAIAYLIGAAAGIPRRLNVLCHNSLLLAYSKNQSTVTLDVAREVVSDYKDIFLPSSDILHPELAALEDVGPTTLRPRPRFALATAACAVLALVGFGGVMVPHSWSGAQKSNAVAFSSSPISAPPAAVDQIHKPSGVDAGVPAAAAATVPAEPSQTIIRIRRGDTFHDLAAKYLGSKDRTRELINANPQIKDPNNLYVGQILYLPSNQTTNLSGVVQ
ncbi:MAG TPA: AAA family ATPase [Candidatus Limnocylindrales bacterium]|nr:AAA family ATPase [Candidatus Limnocylindrales bacterium]